MSAPGQDLGAPSRLNRMLHGAVFPTLALLALPNVAVVAAQSLSTIADAYFLGQLGVVPLAAAAVVFPVQALLSMLSQGAIGGGISSAIARALGGGDPVRANAIAMHAFVVAVVLAVVWTVLFALLARPVFAVLGAAGTVLEATVAYAQVLFGGTLIIWLANTCASVLRGTGNTLVPAVAMILAFAISIPLAGALTMGWAGLPALGVRGPAAAFVLALAIGGLGMAAYIWSGRAGLAPALRGRGLEIELFADILRVGAVASANAVLTIATIMVINILVAGYGPAALAGYGIGSRLEIMLVPLAFGVGGALTAMVGANRGARAFVRARRIAWTGGLTVFVLCGLIGGTVATWPELWIGLFASQEAEAAAIARLYLQIAGPAFAFFGLGMALYFATQGTGSMLWPLLAGTVRAVVVAGMGGALAFWAGAPLEVLFFCVAAGLTIFGTIIAGAVRYSARWNPDRL